MAKLGCPINRFKDAATGLPACVEWCPIEGECLLDKEGSAKHREFQLVLDVSTKLRKHNQRVWERQYHERKKNESKNTE